MRTTQLLKTKIAAILVAALCVGAVAPAVAGAQQVNDPTTEQYGDQLNQFSVGGNDGNSTPPSNDTGLSGNVGPLPFTGFDVIAMAAVALAVTGLGLALQRAVSRDSADELT